MMMFPSQNNPKTAWTSDAPTPGDDGSANTGAVAGADAVVVERRGSGALWPELSGEDLELDRPSVTSREAVAAGEQLCGKAYLNVFSDNDLRSADVRVHVEMEGDSWCCPRNASQAQSRQQQQQAAVATVRRQGSHKAALNRSTSLTFADDDYPKTFHFLKRISVWPRRERGSVYSHTTRPLRAGAGSADGGSDGWGILEGNSLCYKQSPGDRASDSSPRAPPTAQRTSSSGLRRMNAWDDGDGSDDETSDVVLDVADEVALESSTLVDSSTVALESSSPLDSVVFGDGGLLGVGRHVWRFKFSLPATLCSSADIVCTHGLGGVRYRLRSVITISRRESTVTRESAWTPVNVERAVHVPLPMHPSQVSSEHKLSAGDKRQFRLPWNSFQLKANLECSGYPRGTVFPVSVHLVRPRGSRRLKQTCIQAELLQRVTLNLGGKSSPWDQKQPQSSAPQTSGLIVQFHSLQNDSVDCGSTQDFHSKLFLYAPHNILTTFRLYRVAVEYFVEVKLRHNFGNSKRSIVMPVLIGTGVDRTGELPAAVEEANLSTAAAAAAAAAAPVEAAAAAAAAIPGGMCEFESASLGSLDPSLDASVDDDDNVFNDESSPC